MKRLLVLALVCLAVVSCKKDDDDNDLASSSSSSGPGDFMISITIDGVTHKTEGTFSNDYANSPFVQGNQSFNHCYKSLTNCVSAGILDKSASTYVSGETFGIQINFDNLSVGNQVCQLYFTNPINLNFPASAFNSNQVIYSNTIDTASNLTSNFNTLNFNISDLGTIGNIDFSNFTYGNPLKGSFNGTIYVAGNTVVPYSPFNAVGAIFDVPVQIEIEFIAARCQY